MLFIEVDFNYKTIRISNILGETITYKTDINSDTYVDVPNLKYSTYLIDLNGEIQKFVKQ